MNVPVKVLKVWKCDGDIKLKMLVLDTGQIAIGLIKVQNYKELDARLSRASINVGKIIDLEHLLN